MTACKLILVAAYDKEQGIGRNGQLAWNHPSDLKSFRETTMGGWIVMGRMTWLSIGRSLPGRQTVVISNSELDLPEGVWQFGSLEEVIALANAGNVPEIFVCGGAFLYEAAIDRADILVLTMIPGYHRCDRFFPDWTERDFEFHSETHLEGGLRRQVWRRRAA